MSVGGKWVIREWFIGGSLNDWPEFSFTTGIYKYNSALSLDEKNGGNDQD